MPLTSGALLLKTVRSIAKEELRKIAPYHQVISGSRMIGKYMSLQKDDNLSQSFRLFINSIRNLVEHIIDDAVDK